jgi:hypothetical protein
VLLLKLRENSADKERHERAAGHRSDVLAHSILPADRQTNIPLVESEGEEDIVLDMRN